MIEKVTTNIIFQHDRWKKLFYQTMKNNLRTYDNIRKIITSKGADYTTGRLPDYPYFEKYYKSIAIDLSKQQNLVDDQKAIQKINILLEILVVQEVQHCFSLWK